MRSRRSHLSYANVMASIAVFIALGGGAYAAFKLPANSVGSKQLRSGAVTPAKVAPATVRLFKGQKGDKGDTGPQGAPGNAGVNGQDGAAGPSDAYAAGVADKSLSTSLATEVESITVPAGSYVIGASLWFTNGATGTAQLDCYLYDDVAGSTRLNAVSTVIDDATPRSTVPLSAVATFTSPAKVYVQCYQVAHTVIVSEGRLWAIQTGALHATLPLPLD